MPTFAWEGRTRSGETRRGQIDAENEGVVMNRLKNDNIQVTKVKKQTSVAAGVSFGSGVSTKELVIFTRQFATMIDAGLPLVQCLDILAAQAENPRFKVTLEDVKAHVESGATFS